jgi:hypothetical protein
MQIKVKEEELIGIWNAFDGAELSLNEDKTFKLEGLAPSRMKREWKGKDLLFKVNGKGEWKIENRHNKYILELDFIEIMGKTDSIFDGEKYRIKKSGYSMLIIDERGFWGNKPSCFFRDIGIDDELNYDFHKKE